mgnify:CR=1 FL=1
MKLVEVNMEIEPTKCPSCGYHTLQDVGELDKTNSYVTDIIKRCHYICASCSREYIDKDRK